MVATTIDRAIGGDAKFAQIVFDRIAPAPKGSSIWISRNGFSLN
jgi:hypothetical protein